MLGHRQAMAGFDKPTSSSAGTVLRGQPYLSELAWERGKLYGHQAYSLVGMIHTLAPPKVRELIGDALISPVQPPGTHLFAHHLLFAIASRVCLTVGKNTYCIVLAELVL